MRPGAAPPGPGALAFRRLRRDRWALAWGGLFLLLVVAFLAAPLYADVVAGTGPSDNHLTDQITIAGEPEYVVSLEGIPIGPTWHAEYLLGADENGRDLMVRLLYGGRTSLLIGAAALAVTLVLAVPVALAAGYFGGRTDSLISRLLDIDLVLPGAAHRLPARLRRQPERRGHRPVDHRARVEADPGRRHRARLRALPRAPAPR